MSTGNYYHHIFINIYQACAVALTQGGGGQVGREFAQSLGARVLEAATCLVEPMYHFGYTVFYYVSNTLIPYSYLTVIFVKKSKYSVYML